MGLEVIIMKELRIITLQNKEVLDTIEKEGLYIFSDTSKSKFLEQNKNLYLWLTDILKDKLDSKTKDLFKFPVWGWYNFGNEELPIDIKKYGGKCITEEVVLLELSIPENLILLSDYYNWADCMYFYEYPDELESEVGYTSFERLKEDVFYIDDQGYTQAIFPYIKKDMILNVYQ